MSSFFNGAPSNVLFSTLNSGSLNIAGTSNLSGDINIAGNLNIVGTTTSDVITSNNLRVTQNASVDGNIILANNSSVVSSDPNGTIYIGDVGQTVYFRGQTINVSDVTGLEVDGFLDVKYDAEIEGNLTVDGKLIMPNTGTLDATLAASVKVPSVAISGTLGDANKAASVGNVNTALSTTVTNANNTYATKASPAFSGTMTFAANSIITATNATINADALTAVTRVVNDSTTNVATTAFVATSFAPLAGPTFTGIVTVPDQSANNNSTRAANTKYVDTGLALKANLAGPTFTGTVTVPDQSANNNSTSAANTKYVDTGLALKANLAGPTFTGTVAAPTPSASDNSTKVATTAFVANALLENRILNTNTNIYADGTMGAAVSGQQYGWAFNNKNSNNGKKINWYYYSKSTAQNSTSIQLKDLNNMYCVVTEDQTNIENPFFILYTTPTGTGDAAAWYHSKVFYGSNSLPGNVDKTKPILLFTGADDATLHREIPASNRQQLQLNSSLCNPNTINDNFVSSSTEEINLMSLQTSSQVVSNNNYQFVCNEMGFLSTKYNSSYICITSSIVQPAVIQPPAAITIDQYKNINNANTPDASYNLVIDLQETVKDLYSQLLNLGLIKAGNQPRLPLP